MQVSLPSDAKQFIDTLVKTGQYTSASDAVAEGVRLLMSHEKLKEDIQEGIRELDAGLGIDGKQVIEELRQRAEQATTDD